MEALQDEERDLNEMVGEESPKFVVLGLRN